MTEYCAVIGPTLPRARQQTAVKDPSLSCGMGCGHTRPGLWVVSMVSTASDLLVASGLWGAQQVLKGSWRA